MPAAYWQYQCCQYEACQCVEKDAGDAPTTCEKIGFGQLISRNAQHIWD